MRMDDRMDVEANKNIENILFVFRPDNGGAMDASGGRDHAIYTYCSFFGAVVGAK